MSISRSLPDEWIVLANSICFGREIALGVLAQLIRQDEQAVQRRPQLMRHVGEELGLVLRGQRELLGLFFQRLARLFDFLVLAFDLFVLLHQQLRFFLELFVGLLQFLLAALQLMRERLRLLQQILGTHVGFDGVDDDSDTLGELIEQRVMGIVETFQRGQFQHAFDLSFEDDRQDQDVVRRRFAKSGRDLDVILRNLGQRDFLLLQRALADQSFAEIELVAHRAAPLAA